MDRCEHGHHLTHNRHGSLDKMIGVVGPILIINERVHCVRRDDEGRLPTQCG